MAAQDPAPDYRVRIDRHGNAYLDDEEVPTTPDRPVHEQVLNLLALEAAGQDRPVVAAIEDEQAEDALTVRVYPDGRSERADAEPDDDPGHATDDADTEASGDEASAGDPLNALVAQGNPLEDLGGEAAPAGSPLGDTTTTPGLLVIRMGVAPDGTGYVGPETVAPTAEGADADVLRRVKEIAATRDIPVRVVATESDGSVWIIDVAAGQVPSAPEIPQTVDEELIDVRRHARAGRWSAAWLLASGLEREYTGRPDEDPVVLLIREHLAVVAEATGDEARAVELRGFGTCTVYR